MPNFLAWLGWIMSAVQFVWWLMDWHAGKGRRLHLRATRDELVDLRAMCTEAINRGEVIRGDSERQWVRQLAWSLVGIEGHIHAAMGETERDNGDVSPKISKIGSPEIVFEDETRTYRVKVRPVLKNDSGQTITVELLEWLPGGVEVRQPMPRKVLQVQRSGAWTPENAEIRVFQDEVFRLWIGLEEKYTQSDLATFRKAEKLGTLLLRVTMAGRDHEVPITL